MRPLFLALLFVWIPGAASAQSPSTLQQMGAWGQQLAAAQQPVTDVYHECSPTLRQGEDALRAQDRERTLALLTGGAFRACVDRMQAAGRVALGRLAAMGPMPAEMQRMLHVDSRDIVRRSAASVDGMVSFNQKIGEAIDALAAGDEALVLRRVAEARGLAGSVFDGQILLLEILRAGMPLEFHKSMVDLRLALSRSMRILTVTGPALDSDQASAGVRAEAARIRVAARELQANWTRESASLRGMLAGNPRRAAAFARLDEGIAEVSTAGVRLAASLETFPARRLDAAAGMRAMQDLAEAELLVIGLSQRFSVAASELG